MAFDLGNIAIGWGKWLGLIKISPEMKAESERRLSICDGCSYAKDSKFLEFLSSGIEDVKGKYCLKCNCPCHQKSIVENEKCPEGFWEINK